jgi:hypothetical protein
LSRTKGTITKKYEPEFMANEINSYVDECMRKKRVPIFKEVTVKEGWVYFYVERIRHDERYKKVDEAIINLMDAKEYMLERLGLDGKIDKTMAVFSLKQLGWRDNQNIELGGQKDNSLNITIKVAE